VAERDEVCVLGEAVDHREYDGLAAHLREALDEVHGDIRPYLGRNLQRLQQSRRLQGLRLVTLTGTAGPHLVLHQRAIAGDVEVRA